MASPSVSAPVSRPRRSNRRVKTTSSLQGMFEETGANPASPSLSSVGSSSSSSLPKISLEQDNKKLDQEEPKPMTLREMSRNLRKAKRSLLLHSVSEQQKSSVDQFREIILKLAQDTDELSLSSDDYLFGSGVPSE